MIIRHTDERPPRVGELAGFLSPITLQRNDNKKNIGDEMLGFSFDKEYKLNDIPNGLKQISRFCCRVEW